MAFKKENAIPVTMADNLQNTKHDYGHETLLIMGMMIFKELLLIFLVHICVQVLRGVCVVHPCLTAQIDRFW